MNLLAANHLAALLSYVAAGLVAAWYVAPALTRRPLAESLTLLMVGDTGIEPVTSSV